MAIPLTQPVPGEVENALAELYPELVPMPTVDGTVNSLGRRMRDDFYGGGGGLGLLGGGRPPRPNMDATPGERDAAAAAEGWIPPESVLPPNYGVPPILPPGPPVAETWPAAPGPVDLSVIPPNIPPLVPRPGVSAGPLPEAGGLLPPVTRPPNLPLPSYDRGDAGNLISPYTPPPQGSVGAPWNREVFSSALAKTPGPRPAPGDRPAAPGDVGPEGRGMTERPTLRSVVDPPRGVTDQTAKETADIENATKDAKDFLYDAQGQGIGWIDDGVHGFGQSLMLMYGGGLEPTVTQGPPVQFNVLGKPTTSTDYLNFATGSPIIPSLLPEGQRLGQVAPSGVVTTTTTTDDKDTKGTTVGGGSLGLGDSEIQKYLNNKTFDVVGSNLYPEVKIATDGQRYFENNADLVNWAGGFMEETGIDAKPYFYDTFIDGIKKTGNYLLDGAQSFLNVIQGFADFVGDPSKAKGQDATLSTAERSYSGFWRELSEFWETNPNNPWGRNLFKPGETQKYGSLQPYAIISALSNPPAALLPAVKTLVKDIMWSAKNMFAKEANYDGNYVQDIINGAFHLVGSGIKSVGKNFSNLFKGDKTGAKGETVEGETAEDSQWLENLQKSIEKTDDDKLRDSWLTHAGFDSSTHKITEAFLSEGVPVVLKDNKDKFIKAINDRKMDDFFGLMDEFRVDSSIFDLLAGAAGLDPDNQAEANMIDILREWQRQRDAYP